MSQPVLPDHFGADLPAWVAEEVAAFAPPLTERANRIALTNVLAERNFREDSGGPFAALVYDLAEERLVSAGVNLVLSSNLSSAHAEVTALSLAQTALASWDLSAGEIELDVNWRPCAMCYGATIWAGVRVLAIAGSGDEITEYTGFNEGPMRDDWAEQMHQRGIEVLDDQAKPEAIEVFRRYRASDPLVYNPARG